MRFQYTLHPKVARIFRQGISRSMTAAVFTAAVIIPLIVKSKALTIPSAFLALSYPNPLTDGFSWYKSLALSFCGLVAGLALLLSLPLRRRKIVWAFIGLIVLTLSSSLLSPYRDLNFYGVPFIFEGLPTQLAYLVLAIAAMHCSQEFSNKILPRGLAVSSFIIATFGLLEVAGIDLINQPWLNRILLAAPDGSVSLYERTAFGAALPFGNPNYTGLYAAMIWPFFLLLSLLRSSRSDRILFSLAAAASFAELLASNCRGGFIAASISVTLGLIVLFWRLRPRPHITLCLALLAIHLLSGYLVARLTPIRADERLATIPPEFSVPNFSAPASPAASTSTSTSAAITPIMNVSQVSLESGRLRLAGTGPEGPWALLLERQYKSVKFMTADYRPLIFRARDLEGHGAGEIELLERPYQSLKLTLRDAGVFRVLSIQNLDIAITNYGFRVGRVGAFVSPVIAKRFPLPLSDQIFSQRGFIWAYSLPLLSETVWLGKGPAAFPFAFPNNDPVTMSASFGPDSIVDKPHNFYIGFAHSNGLVALAILLTLMGSAFVRMAKSVMLNAPRRDFLMEASPYFFACLGFAITGLSVDSNIGVSSIFWIALGILLAQFSSQHSSIRNGEKST